MNKSITALCFLLCAGTAQAQMDANKSGDITSGGQVVAEVEKYGGSAETRPKFRLVNTSKDTVMLINFKKDLAYDWMQFWVKGSDKPVEVNTAGIISGLNYRKNIGAFLVKQNLIGPDGKLNDTAFQRFAGQYNENLTEKYAKANEMERKLLNTRFDWTPENNNYVHINGQKAGSATVPETTETAVANITFYDLNGKSIGVGTRNGAGTVVMQMHDGRQVSFPLQGNTSGYVNKKTFLIAVFRELCRNGYYPI